MTPEEREELERQAQLIRSQFTEAQLGPKAQDGDLLNHRLPDPKKKINEKVVSSRLKRLPK